MSSRTWTLKVHPFIVYSLIVWTSCTWRICNSSWDTLSVFVALWWRGTWSLYNSSNSCCLELESLENCCSLECLLVPIFESFRKNAVFSMLVFKLETDILSLMNFKPTLASQMGPCGSFLFSFYGSFQDLDRMLFILFSSSKFYSRLKLWLPLNK